MVDGDGVPADLEVDVVRLQAIGNEAANLLEVRLDAGLLMGGDRHVALEHERLAAGRVGLRLGRDIGGEALADLGIAVVKVVGSVPSSKASAPPPAQPSSWSSTTCRCSGRPATA
jgi:hypothetical protein